MIHYNIHAGLVAMGIMQLPWASYLNFRPSIEKESQTKPAKHASLIYHAFKNYAVLRHKTTRPSALPYPCKYTQYLSLILIAILLLMVV